MKPRFINRVWAFDSSTVIGKLYSVRPSVIPGNIVPNILCSPGYHLALHLTKTSQSIAFCIKVLYGEMNEK